MPRCFGGEVFVGLNLVIFELIGVNFCAVIFDSVSLALIGVCFGFGWRTNVR